jgi:NosR/NirI family nitrous oxide reductase transcriptional regulator
VLLALLGTLSLAIAQTSAEATLQAQMRRVFPVATSFSTKQPGPPSHFVAYTGSGAARVVVGYVFWTTELEPLERGYDGPIKVLVGMDTKGILTGVAVTEHNEPYGYFSVEPAPFAEQFKNKDIRDTFKVGADVAAVSRATITITSTSRAIRNSARRVARALLTPPAPAK